MNIKLRDMSERQTNPRIYFFLKNETLLENFKNRWNRLHKEYRRLFPEIAKQLKLKADIKANWSQYAGCSCGCSPAFIVKNAGEINLNKDVFVTID